VKVNLLDDDIVDTLASVGATSAFTLSFPSTPRRACDPPSRSTSPSGSSRSLSTTRVTHDDGIDFSGTSGGQHPGTAECHEARRYFSRRGDRLRLAADRHQSISASISRTGVGVPNLPSSRDQLPLARG
jgi:hypothetical protein